MTQLYKGLTIPAYSDAADGPAAFQGFVDSGPVARFADATARDAAIVTPVQGQLIYNTGLARYETYNGTAWVNAFITVAGFTMTGQINMGTQRIINVGAATAAGDAVSRSFGDGRFAALSHSHDGGDITTGTINAVRIPNLPASRITTGTFAISLIPTGTTSSTVSLGNHNHNASYYTETETEDRYANMYWGATRRTNGPRINVGSSQPIGQAGDIWIATV